MKKSSAFFFFFFFLSQVIFSQHHFAIGIEGSPKFTFQTEPSETSGYSGLFSFDLGLTVSKPIPRTNIWLHSGLFFSKFADKTRNTIKDFDTPNDVWITDKKYTSRAVNIPIGAKVFFSDRTCYMFFQPALEFDIYFQSEERIEYIFNDGSNVINRNITNAGEEISFVLAGSLSLGGQVPLGDKMAISLQLRTAVGLLGTNQFSNGKPLSLGIRTGILRYF